MHEDNEIRAEKKRSKNLDGKQIGTRERGINMQCLLMNHINKSEVVSLYCDSNVPATHLTGFIAGYDNDWILVNHVSKNGLYDGFILIRSDDLHRVDFGGQYEKKIKTLYNIRKQSHPVLLLTDDLCTALLHFGLEHNLVASLELEDCTIRGFIKSYDDVCIHICLLDEYGARSGESCVLRENIISLAVDTTTEQDINLLYYHYIQNPCE